MPNNSIVDHKANYYFVPLREEFLIICWQCKYKKPGTPKSKCKASPYCKAYILAILESWTNDKRGQGSLAVFMTYKQWSDSMYGLYGRNVIIDSLDELIGEGLIAREPYKMHGKDTFQYFLNYRELNKRIKLLPERAPEEKFPQVIHDPFAQDSEGENTRLLVNPTDLLVNEDPFINKPVAFTSNHNIERSKKRIKETNRERDSERSAKPSTSSQPEQISLSVFYLSFFQSFNEERNACFDEETKTHRKISMPKLSSKEDSEKEQFAEWAAAGVTPEQVKQGVRNLWSKPWWKFEERFTFAAFCRNFDPGQASLTLVPAATSANTEQSLPPAQDLPSLSAKDLKIIEEHVREEMKAAKSEEELNEIREKYREKYDRDPEVFKITMRVRKEVLQSQSA